MTNTMRARAARIAAAAVFVAGASLAVAGYAAAEEPAPDPCAANPFASGCPLDLGFGSPAPTGQTTEPGATDDTKGNGKTPSDESSTSAAPTTTTPPPSGGETATQPPGNQGSTPPAGTPTTTPPGTGAPTSTGQQCDIARGGVDCGKNTKSPSPASGDNGGPQRNYGGGTTPSAGAAAADSTGGSTGNAAELADTGQGANLTLVIVGGATMAAGGFAFTVLPGRLNRRTAGGTATA